VPTLAPRGGDRTARETTVLNHAMVGSNDIERSKRFYDAVLGTLGCGEGLRHTADSGHVRLFYRHDGSVFAVSQPIDDRPATPANGGTIGFRCASPEAVRTFHDTALAHGGTTIEEPPGLRQGTLGDLHLAYVRDPDGNKLCAIHRPR
jgi:catechol 2,3-dioxygenase-like lactoylglutathione lyase family enzyme